jgi:hypothetical protein
MTTSRLAWQNAGVAAGGGSEMRWGFCAAHGDFPKDGVRASLENELVRLRAQIATLEERNANLEERLEERRGHYESENEFMERQVARRSAQLEERGGKAERRSRQQE